MRLGHFAVKGSTGVRQKESFNQRVGFFLIALAIFAVFAAILFFHPPVSSVVDAQTRRQQTRSKPQTKSPSSTVPASSSFKHEHHRPPKVDLNCSGCHTVLSPEASNVVAPATKMSTKGYPYHDKCLDCHRAKQPPTFFSGTRPVICVVCHTRSSPRLSKNDMMPFPKESEQMILGNLSLKFNHESTSHRRECTTCHLNIVQLDIAKADSPISSCASSACHLKTAKPSVEAEMLDEDDDIAEGTDNDFNSKQGKHTCTGCHTALIGSMPPPCSHYCLFGDTYFKLGDYPKSAKQLSEQCKCKK